MKSSVFHLFIINFFYFCFAHPIIIRLLLDRFSFCVNSFFLKLWKHWNKIRFRIIFYYYYFFKSELRWIAQTFFVFKFTALFLVMYLRCQLSYKPLIADSLLCKYLLHGFHLWLFFWVPSFMWFLFTTFNLSTIESMKE